MMNIRALLRQSFTLNTLALLPLLFAVGCDVSPETDGKVITNQESDPILTDYPIAFIERPLPTDDNGDIVPFDVVDQAAFHPGARLILKDRASATAKETVITAGLFEGLEVDPQTGEEISTYDVKDLEVSNNGRKLLFAMRAPEDEDEDDDNQPTWDIWEYDLDSDPPQPRRLIDIDQEKTARLGEDVEPYYLPNGRIVFSSTRQARTKAISIDEGKSQYPPLDDKLRIESMSLHTMEDDGSDVRQISFNVSQDLEPSVLQSGEIIFLRRDAINGHDQLSLYKANPDGSNVQLYYGFHTQDTGTNASPGVFMQPREMPDGRIMVNLQPRDALRFGGDIVAIDAKNYIANNQGIDANRGAIGPAQQSLIRTPLDSSGETPSKSGYFSSAFPLDDGTSRILVSWSECVLINPETNQLSHCDDTLIEAGAEQAPPAFGVSIYDPINGTKRPIILAKLNTMFTDAVALAPKQSRPDDIRSTDLDPDLITANIGILHIRNVYDIDGTDSLPNGIDVIANPTQTDAENRPARFIRIVKNVPIPDDDVWDFVDSAFGPSRNQGMRDIVGYVPIEPDGSAKFKVPSDIPFMIDLLDEQGRRTNSRHENWLSVTAGEERECTGCHTRNSELPHGRQDAEASSVYLGATGGTPFPGTQLRDANGTPEVDPESGETMAEYYARLFGARTPSMDLIFTDDWTDPEGLFPPASAFQWRYIDIKSRMDANPSDSKCNTLDVTPPTWTAPTNCTAAGSWASICRSTINYIDSIHPLWEADRRTCDDSATVIQDHTCTSCHSSAGNTIIAAGQLELTSELSREDNNNNNYMTSYFELVAGVEKKIIKIYRSPAGELFFELENEFERVFTNALELDENGDPLFDDLGNTIPKLQVNTVGDVELDPDTGEIFLEYTNGDQIRVETPLNRAGALQSNRFFSVFDAGGIHEGYLNADELKLISEWIDIGGQYYNNPKDAPLN